MGGLVSDDRPGSRTAGEAEAATTAERPVPFRDLFALREYRAVYVGLLASWIGDYLARAAITVLVYEQSSSVVQAAAAFVE